MPGKPRPKKPVGGPIRFTADYNHIEGPRTTAYKKGMVKSVPGSHRKAALAKGRAEEWTEETAPAPDGQ